MREYENNAAECEGCMMLHARPSGRRSAWNERLTLAARAVTVAIAFAETGCSGSGSGSSSGSIGSHLGRLGRPLRAYGPVGGVGALGAPGSLCLCRFCLYRCTLFTMAAKN